MTLFNIESEKKKKKSFRWLNTLVNFTWSLAQTLFSFPTHRYAGLSGEIQFVLEQFCT